MDTNFSDDPATGAFGLPENLGDVAPATFDPERRDRTRSLAIEIPAAGFGLDSPTEFVVRGGAELHVPLSLLPSRASEAAPSGASSAPALPAYYKLSRTHYTTAAPLKSIEKDLEGGFAEMGVEFMAEAVGAYACKGYEQHGLLEFVVSVFSTDGATHVVEFELLSGCRFSWKSLREALQTVLKHCPSGSLSTPPSSPRGLPGLRVPELATAGSFTLPKPALSASTSACTADDVCPLTDMMEEGGEAREEASRAVCALSVDPTASGLFFDAETSAPLPLAEAVAEQLEDSEDEVAWLAAVSVVANLASKGSCSAEWLLERVGGLKKALVSDNHHARREAARALALGMSRDLKGLGVAVVKAGLIPELELEAEGGCEEDRCEDRPARAFASAALISCRA